MKKTVTLICLVYCFTINGQQVGSDQERPGEGPIKVEVVETDDGYELLRDGKPYFVRGAGSTGADYGTVVEHGGNSIRTWGIDMAKDKLDAAHRHGLTVALCLPVVSERFGFDYNNPVLVKEQREFIETIVERYKDHPALLAWIIGNELNYNMRNHRVYDAVNEISEYIHEVDPNHPTTTAVAGADENIVSIIKERAPDLDFLSVQLYGAIAELPKYADSSLSDIPFMITEWGPLGHWEIAKTAWEAPIEHTSREKANRLMDTYLNIIAPNDQNLLGTYVFFWSQKQERTPTWYSLFLESGEPTEAIDTMQYLWTETWPENRAPRIDGFPTIDKKNAHDNVRITVGNSYAVSVTAFDEDEDSLSYHWFVKQESQSHGEGGDFEESIDNLPYVLADPFSSETTLQAPATLGAYRLFVNVYDDHGNAAHANMPFYVDEAP